MSVQINNLVRRIEFASKAVFFTPPDPYRIYERLAKLFMQAQVVGGWEKGIRIVSNKKIDSPYDLLRGCPFSNSIGDEWSQLGFNPDYRTPLRFLKWVYQEIPSIYWKYNVNIYAVKDKIIESAEQTKQNEIWVRKKARDPYMYKYLSEVGLKNTEGTAQVDAGKKDIKAVAINSWVRDDLKEGKLFLPSYEEIAKEVESWGDYVYKFGQIKEVSISGKKE